MNGIDFLADTNAILYLLNKNSCMVPYLTGNFGISVITEMELLSFQKITSEEEKLIRKLISKCEVLQLTPAIKEHTIKLRRTYGTKLPDSIIAATAIELGVPIISADKGLQKITELDLKLLEPEIS